jgi:hypothetical protein
MELCLYSIMCLYIVKMGKFTVTLLYNCIMFYYRVSSSHDVPNHGTSLWLSIVFSLLANINPGANLPVDVNPRVNCPQETYATRRRNCNKMTDNKQFYKEAILRPRNSHGFKACDFFPEIFLSTWHAGDRCIQTTSLVIFKFSHH